MKIRVTVDFEVKAEDKYRIAAKVEESANKMALEVGEEGATIGDTKLTFPTGTKGPRKAKKPDDK